MDQALATVEFGALVSWVGAMTCWQALVWAHQSWFKNPTNKAKYLNESNKMFLSCIGKPDSPVNYILPFNCHPPTISQMIGDSGNPTGAMMLAVGLPGLVLIIIGNVMLYGAGVEHYSRAGIFCAFILAYCPPLGFLYVLFTPMKNIDQTKVLLDVNHDGVVTAAEQRGLSDFELRIQNECLFVHMLGFFVAAVVPALFAPFPTVFALWDYAYMPADDSWPTAARVAYLTLLSLRLSASLLIFVVLVRFCGTDDNSPPAAYEHGTKYYKFMCEYTVLLLAFCPVLFDSCTVFVSHKHSTSGSVGWISCVLTLVLVAYTIYSFVFQVLKTLIPLVWYRPDDKSMSAYLRALYFGMRNDTWRALGDHYVAGAAGASESTRAMEDLWHVRLVQAGVADDKGEEDGLGGSYVAKPAVYVVSPASFLPSSALEIQQLDSMSLGLFSASLTRSLRVLAQIQTPSESPITLGFPFGTTMKNNVRAPVLWIKMADHAATHTALCGESSKPNTATSDEAFTPKVGDKVMELVWLDVRSLVLRDLPMLQTSSILDVLSAGEESSRQLMTYFSGVCGDQILPPYSDWATNPAPPPSPASYELQVCGLQMAPPLAITIRLPKKDVQFLPSEWQSQSSVEPVCGSETKKKQ